MDVCRCRIASGGTPVVRHLIFTSSTPILQHQSSVSHRWDRVSYDLVCRENLRRWTDPAPREYARIKSLTECLWCGDQKTFGTILRRLTIGVLPMESTISLDTPICLVPVLVSSHRIIGSL